ncbi:hypothetical protein PGB90_000489 [Kerria lacca]
MAATSYQQYHEHHRPLKILNRDDSCFVRVKPQSITKRKSAVELLQETKPLYVKSEIVLDRKQELRRSLRSYQLPNDEEFLNGYSNSLLNRLNNSTSPPLNNHASQNNSSTNGGTAVPFPIPKNPRFILPPPAFRKSTSSLQLQNKLRKLLNADSKENLLETNSIAANDESSASVKENNKVKYYNSKSEFANENYSKEINLSCHKSLPDLSNIRDLSSRSEEKSDVGSCGYAACSTSSDGICKKSTHMDCISLASCKNDYLYASKDFYDKNEDENRKHLKTETNDGDLHENSFFTLTAKLNTNYVTPPLLYRDTNELLRSRPISRSKSDVGARNVSSLQSVDIPLYDSSTLNIFFDNLGLESDEYSSLTAPRSDASSPVYFESSNSSVDSIGDYASGNENPPINHIIESPSIIERNARIIKWLCNCRKVLDQVPRIVIPQSR